MRTSRYAFLLLLASSSSRLATGLVPSSSSSTSNNSPHSSSRRAFIGTALTTSAAAAATVVLVASTPQVSYAAGGGGTPMVTIDEFYSIVKDSGRSIDRVEFRGSKSEIVTVKLMDGTTFGIKDVKESPTDPRSPLKISAVCRQNNVPTKFVDLEAALSGAPRRKKVYANQRVLEAASKEKERLARIERDEEQRLAEVQQQQQQQQQEQQPAGGGGE